MPTLEHADRTGRVRRMVTQLSSTTRTPREARAFVEESLRAWGLPESLVADVLLATSELVTNAVQHAGAEPVVELRAGDRRLVLRVRDHTTRTPTRKPLTRSAPGGRGLVMVEALSSRWGHTLDEQGKWVWAEFPLDSGSRRR
jgi:anti-sigma regulatory factor (Ser/Thr protein kinase)